VAQNVQPFGWLCGAISWFPADGSPCARARHCGDAAAWYIEGFPVSEGESALEGVTQIKGDIGFHYVTMCLTVLKA